ncbi:MULTISPECIES: hypothetical protein [Sinorhizobium/Ensifer group]|uniref:Uncharacterized protein n=1 Tax=Sinorhizobium alkalisoli TaxID=1752398 RepID=A0A1E3VC51_9HYPH|nr:MULTISPECIES: hypothetical protein [Sinorhizobium/Ensifer group]MCA1494124.1 hypothetical protein [Ensifer sp. NBAIM29]MCG5479092.1 hypothetical protein [Sinorhizobium alkalisoli]ODR91144.1 hypothetical protein A8M32_09990 [Sinorhizobium alkalisoli]OHV77936.1 hypothetical protein LCM4579_06180 [Ensifer sp. LCM 4579]QFI66799.1 hypothetical protein EKH55_1925 [Sinorhizobium alkalisoli]
MAKHHSLARDLTALWFQAPLVIATRTQAMAMAAMTGSAADYAEASRMVTEKMAAAAECAVAANMALMKEGMNAAAAIATGGKAATAGRNRVAAAALRPYAKRVRANARRLVK